MIANRGGHGYRRYPVQFQILLEDVDIVRDRLHYADLRRRELARQKNATQPDVPTQIQDSFRSWKLELVNAFEKDLSRDGVVVTVGPEQDARRRIATPRKADAQRPQIP